MSGEWKYAQALKRKNQNISFMPRGYKVIGEGKVYKPKPTSKEYRRELMWGGRGSEFYFSECKEEALEDIQDYIEECQVEGKPIAMDIAGLSIKIDEKNPHKIDFVSKGDKNYTNVGRAADYYPYRVSIKDDDIFSEVDIINEKVKASYIKEGKIDTNLKMSRVATVVDAEEINECIIINDSQNNPVENIDNIVESFISCNPKYSRYGENGLVRDNVDPNEKINDIVQSVRNNSQDEISQMPDGVYETYLDYREYNETHSKSIVNLFNRKNNPTYGTGIEAAKDIIEHCKRAYSIIMEVYKKIEKKKNEVEQGSKEEESAEPEKMETIKVNPDIKNEQQKEDSKSSLEESDKATLIQKILEQQKLILEQQKEINELKKQNAREE